jgi:hypothetical protein
MSSNLLRTATATRHFGHASSDASMRSNDGLRGCAMTGSIETISTAILTGKRRYSRLFLRLRVA